MDREFLGVHEASSLHLQIRYQRGRRACSLPTALQTVAHPFHQCLDCNPSAIVAASQDSNDPPSNEVGNGHGQAGVCYGCGYQTICIGSRFCLHRILTVCVDGPIVAFQADGKRGFLIRVQPRPAIEASLATERTSTGQSSPLHSHRQVIPSHASTPFHSQRGISSGGRSRPRTVIVCVTRF